MPGGSIHRLLEENGKFPDPLLRTYTRHIVSGLSYLHGMKTVHRYGSRRFPYFFWGWNGGKGVNRGEVRRYSWEDFGVFLGPFLGETGGNRTNETLIS